MLARQQRHALARALAHPQRRSLATPRPPQPLTPPTLSLLSPLLSWRRRSQYKRERAAAAGVLLRHFRQPDIVDATRHLHPDVVDAVSQLGYRRPWAPQVVAPDPSNAWVYDFRTVEGILAFLDQRSSAQFLYNGLSLASVVAGALITLYYNEMSKVREERRLADELANLEAMKVEQVRRERWDELYDIAAADAPGAVAMVAVPVMASSSSSPLSAGAGSTGTS
ncbi:hypothetical protein BC828DRAFT_409933, partial [Blastocladiella britannica]